VRREGSLRPDEFTRRPADLAYLTWSGGLPTHRSGSRFASLPLERERHSHAISAGALLKAA
jgi:hypothetical protein